MDTYNTLKRTALIGLVFVLAVGGMKVVNSAPDGAKNGVPAEGAIEENEKAEGMRPPPIK